MTTNNPLVSVILPVYNGERYLAEAIESVLAQTYRPVELIVVDDGSTDGTAEIAESYSGVRYLHQPNQGNGRARNAGLKAAQKDLIAAGLSRRKRKGVLDKVAAVYILQSYLDAVKK